MEMRWENLCTATRLVSSARCCGGRADRGGGAGRTSSCPPIRSHGRLPLLPLLPPAAHSSSPPAGGSQLPLSLGTPPCGWAAKVWWSIRQEVSPCQVPTGLRHHTVTPEISCLSEVASVSTCLLLLVSISACWHLLTPASIG